MGDSKEIIESFKDGIKNGKKQHLKSSKNRNNSKNNNNKVPGLMLSRIEEFIEIGHGEKGLKERLLDTCVLKNIKKLFLNKDGENNKENNDILGYSIDNKNKTIIKFNKSPNQLQIEEFIFPGKKKKNNEDYNVNVLNDYSTDNPDINNISENRGDFNFIKKFKDNYQSDVEERIKKHNKVKSNIVLAPKKLKKELKGYKCKNTVFIKPSTFNTILDPNPNSKEKKKIKSHDKEKDNNLRDKQKSNKKEEIKKLKEKDKDKEKDINNPNDKIRTIREESKIIKKVEDNNNNIETIRRKKKSKTRKQGKITFLLNRGKSFGKKNENIISNNNIEKKDYRKLSNNDVLNKEFIKKSSKNKIKSNKANNNLRSSLKSCCFEIDKVPKSPKSKKSKRNKIIKFQSVIFPQNNIMLDQKNKQLGLKNKNSTNLTSKNGEEKNTENNISCHEKSIKKTLSSHSEEKNNKNKHKKQINQNNIKVYKEDINNNCKTKNNENTRKNSSVKINFDKTKIKDTIGIKNSLKNSNYNLLKMSQYKIKHVNDIYYGKNQIKKDSYKSPIMRIPVFSVVKPEKLIHFEYNRAYERPNNQNKILVNNHKELLNDENNSNNDSSDNDESKSNKIKKKSRSVFCCL